MATENPEGFCFRSVEGRGEGRTLFFSFFFFVYLRQPGIELSSVGVGLTWATRCSCLPTLDSYAMDVGLLFVNTGKSLYLYINNFSVNGYFCHT